MVSHRPIRSHRSHPDGGVSELNGETSRREPAPPSTDGIFERECETGQESDVEKGGDKQGQKNKKTKEKVFTVSSCVSSRQDEHCAFLAV